jgi:yecA family protein
MFELQTNHYGRSMKPQPLTDAEFDRLSAVLGRFDNQRPMNLEQLDGFFAALICGPVNVPPSEYLPVILGDDIVLEDTVNAQPVLQDFLSLLMRHWNAIVDTLHSGEVFLPLLLQDENEISHANDWAKGFLRGMDLHKSEWAALLNDQLTINRQSTSKSQIHRSCRYCRSYSSTLREVCFFHSEKHPSVDPSRNSANR